MARLAHPGLEKWYATMARWVDVAFVKGDSLFTPGTPIWTSETLKDVHHRYIEKADAGAGDYFGKLKDQLNGAIPSTVQFFGELLYVFYMPSIGMKATTKRYGVNLALSFSPTPMTLPNDLAETLEVGIVREGQNYRNAFWQTKLLIEVLMKWWQQPADVRGEMLKDPWQFKQFVVGVPAFNNWAMQQLLLHYVHPDTFEPIMTGSHKEEIAATLAEGDERKLDDVDRQLLAIRTRLTPTLGAGFSFYQPQLKARWKPAATEPSDEDDGNDAEEGTADDVSEHEFRCWKIAPGEQARLWEQCRDNGFICIGWNGFGDMRHVDRESFDAAIPKLMAEKKYKKGCRVVWTFAKKIKPGDIIVANRGTRQIVGIGRVTGKYYFEPTHEYGHRLPVEWYDTIPKTVDYGHWVGTLKRVKEKDFNTFAGPNPPPPPPPPLPDPDEDTEPVGQQPDDKIVSLLLSRMNVVLHGPPGTGKTHAALHVADLWKAWQGPKSVAQVTFHPSYAYEDFIEGFRPNDAGKFVLQPGIFVNVCDTARKSPKRKFLLIIDELNRGDVARIFGELITLIERDKRSDRASRKLPYSRRDFHVPENLYLLGTMNTADRSISLLDIAIRRRFCFVEYPPDVNAIQQSDKHYQEIEGVELAKLMLALNARLNDAGVERDRAIGHSHFLIVKNGASPLAELRSRIRHDIIPLIEEYCYANRSQMASILGAIIGSDGLISDDVLDDDGRLVGILTKLCEPGK